jgi:hypothetical protein
MSDDDFVNAFENASLDALPHRDHVRLACLYLERFAEREALERLVDGLRRFAAAKGTADKFHYTMTRAWLELIVASRRSHPQAADADALIDACPSLATSRALARYYSEGVLSSAAARADWVPPDLMRISGSV